MFRLYIRPFFRQFRKQLFVNGINLLGLTLALTFSLGSFLYVINEWFFDRHHERHDRIYRVTYRFANDDGYDIHWARVENDWVNELPNRFPEVDALVSFQAFRPRNVMVGDQKFRESYAYAVDPEVFKVFSFSFIHGQPASALSDPHSVVLTKSTAVKYFGSEDVLGNSVYILHEGEKVPYKITGIIKDPPASSHMPVTFLSSINSDEERTGWAYCYLLLNKNAKIATLKEKIPELINERLGAGAQNYQVYLQPLTDIHLHSNLSREIVPNGRFEIVVLFACIGIFILLIAGINYANLNMARFLSRTREAGIRKTIGAGSHQLQWGWLVETFSLTLISLVLASFMFFLILPRIEMIIGYPLSFHWSLLFPFILLSIFLLTLLSALYPAWLVRSLNPIRALSGNLNEHFSDTTLRKVLLGIQFFLVLGLLSATFLIDRQFKYLVNQPLGYESENLLAIQNFHFPLNEDYEELRQKLVQVPSIEDVTALMEMPTVPIKDEGKLEIMSLGEEHSFTTDIQVMDINGLSVMGMKLLAGKPLSEHLKQVTYDPEDDFLTYLAEKPRQYLINERVLNLVGWESPEEAINQQISWSIGDVKLGFGPIVGVIKDYHQEDLSRMVDPLVITYEPIWLQNVLIKLNSGNVHDAITRIEDLWHQQFPSQPFEITFLDEAVQKSYAREKTQRFLMNMLTLIAIVVTGLGLSGLVSFTIERRLKEMAIRKVLGATIKDLLWLLGFDYIRLIIFSLIAAAPLVYYFGNEWLSDYAYHIHINGTSFIWAGIVLTLLIMLTIYLNALRVEWSRPSSILKDN
jgi:putative ABC transport system permease protein